MTEWRTVPGFENYQVSNTGDLRKTETRQPIQVRRNSNGYMIVDLHNQARVRKTIKVHRIVAFSFLGFPPNGCTDVAHNDGNRENNTLSNLRWSSRGDNLLDMRKHGTLPDRSGEKQKDAKLTNAIVMEIRERAKNGKLKVRETAREIGVSHSTVLNAAKRETWKHLN